MAGIPLWWKTTEVYRASIPNVDSWAVPQALDERFPQAVEVHLPAQVTKPSEVLSTLKNIAMRQVGLQSYIPKFEFFVSTNRFLEKYEEADYNGKESDYDDVLWENFGSYESTGRIYFYVVHSPKASLDGDFYFTKWGGVLIKTSASLREGAGLPIGVITSIGNAIVKLWFGAIDTAQQRIAVPVAAEHRITFTLMSGGPLPDGTNPERFAKAVSRTSLEQTYCISVGYFDDFAKNFSAAAKLSITTQVQQMVAPLKAPQYDSKSNTFFYTRENLPYFLRPADLISDATATNQSGLHFIMYLPASSISPLRIKDSPTNAYLIPRTGGVFINNVYESPDTSSFGITSKDLTMAMRTFVAQLRELLGVPIVRIPGAKTIPTPSGLAYWERDLVFKQRIAEYLRSSVSSLSSIHRLVSTITRPSLVFDRSNGEVDMGVLDDVKERVERILAKIDETKRALRDSAYLTALKASRTAFVESERLFFDPNMLPQLYFPDEHKYAIYVPMFLPILVPILTGIFGEFRERRERGKKAAVTPTKKND